MGLTRKVSKAMLKRQQNKLKRERKNTYLKNQLAKKVQEKKDMENGIKKELSQKEWQAAEDFRISYMMTGKIPGQERRLTPLGKKRKELNDRLKKKVDEKGLEEKREIIRRKLDLSTKSKVSNGFKIEEVFNVEELKEVKALKKLKAEELKAKELKAEELKIEKVDNVEELEIEKLKAEELKAKKLKKSRLEKKLKKEVKEMNQLLREIEKRKSRINELKKNISEVNKL